MTHKHLIGWAALYMMIAVDPLAAQDTSHKPGANPIIRDRFTADPAPLVVGDTLYLYTGHDQAADGVMFDMRDWLVFSTKDMKTWTPHAPIMKATDFKWAKGDAWASQAIEKNGKFYFYAAVGARRRVIRAWPSASPFRTVRPVLSPTRADRP